MTSPASSPPSDAWVKVGEQTVLDTPAYLWVLEEFRNGDAQMVFVHLTIRKWLRATFKELLAHWKLFREVVTCPIYACPDDDDDKFAQFAGLFGFKPISEAMCTDGKLRRIFVSLKENKNNGQQQHTDAGEHGINAGPVVRTDAVPDAGVLRG